MANEQHRGGAPTGASVTAAMEAKKTAPTPMLTKSTGRHSVPFGQSPDMGRDMMTRMGGQYGKRPDPSTNPRIVGF